MQKTGQLSGDHGSRLVFRKPYYEADVRLSFRFMWPCGGTELGGMDYIIARKVLKKFESMNVSFVRDEITGTDQLH